FWSLSYHRNLLHIVFLFHAFHNLILTTMPKSKSLPPFVLTFISLILIVIGISLQFIHSQLDSWTIDEPAHIKSGIEWFNTGKSPTDPYNPGLAKLPFAFINKYHPNSLIDPFLVIPRSVSIVIYGLLALVIFHWTKKHISPQIAFFSTLLFTAEPILLAFGHLATTEIYSTLFFFFTIIFLINYFAKPNTTNTLCFWISFALITSTKMILIPSVIISLIFLGFHKRKFITRLLHPKYIFFYLLLLWALHGFQVQQINHTHISLPLGELFNTFARTITYVLDPKYNQTRLLVYMESVRGHGWWSYALVSLFIKSSLPLIFFSIMGVIKVPKSRKFFAVALSHFFIVTIGRYSTGVRHLLPIYPFLIITASFGIHYLFKTRFKHIVSLVLIITLFSAVSLRDNLAYFNPLIGPKLGGKIVSDSSVDWGQSLNRLYLQHGNSFDYIAPHSLRIWHFYGFTASSLPLPSKLSPEAVAGKRIAISRHIWYTQQYNKHPLFKEKIPEYAADHTYLIFDFKDSAN
ncbi:hypothetical protein ACFL2V_18295, partial [Pseudomonadota bacterium]